MEESKNELVATNHLAVVEQNVQTIDKIDEPAVESSPYIGFSMHQFSDEEVKLLMEDAPIDIIEVRPDGLIYVPGIFFRNKLNRVFKPGGWALIQTKMQLLDNYMYFHGRLYVRGKFVAEAIGEQQYFIDNPQQTYASASESSKTDCLTRCCKDLGIYANLWSPSFVREYIEKYCVKVKCMGYYKSNKEGQIKYLWRKNDSKPIDQWPWKEVLGEEPDKEKISYKKKTKKSSPVTEGESDLVNADGSPDDTPKPEDGEPSPEDLNKSTKYPPWYTQYLNVINKKKSAIVDITGTDSDYYAILRRHGMDHANQFDWKGHTTEQNYDIARKINEEMELAIIELKKLKSEIPTLFDKNKEQTPKHKDAVDSDPKNDYPDFMKEK